MSIAHAKPCNQLRWTSVNIALKMLEIREWLKQIVNLKKVGLAIKLIFYLNGTDWLNKKDIKSRKSKLHIDLYSNGKQIKTAETTFLAPAGK